jgi:hypothetical protein
LARYEITIEHRPEGDLFHVWNSSGVLVYTTTSLSDAHEWLDQQENQEPK